MKALACGVFAALLAIQAFAGARAADLSLGIDPMVLQFEAPYGGNAHARVAVTNAGRGDEIVYARAIDWHTSPKGSVMFESPGTEGAHSLTGALTLEPASFVLHAGETREIAVTLRMPAKAAGPAALWGGFILRAAASGASTDAAVPGGTILVYDTVGTPLRHVHLATFSASSGAHRELRVAADFVNDGQTYVRPLVRVVVQKGNRILRDETLPCSVIFPGDRRSLAAHLDGMATGLYRVHLLVDYGGNTILDGVTDAAIR